MKPADELRHLLGSVNPEERVEGFLIVFKARCNGNAKQVLQNCREVLSVVLRQYGKPWPSEDEWLDLLPQWFIRRCAPERTLEEEEQDLSRWRTLSREEQLQELENEQWSVMEWIGWFDLYEPRYWFWWDAVVKCPNLLLVAVELVDFTFPTGSLEWLLKASGAIEVEEMLDEIWSR
ncbi:MAG: hypothetical protein SVX43_00335 [Cyanobacteriota bacterium]|nr:hypothetical protein [Cyanobacteriota bacterium]